ncbi:MAG: response regulator transcription factor [Pantoea dispersa]|jgi:two-component system capsular synthesis response regulator RcsB|nr:response regulator transcription factor [Pantoea dispersa]MBZ6392450.1 response regulator transcription factor [Pantoea dispersa]
MTMSKPTIRLAILDDHPIIRRSFQVVASNTEDICIVGNFGHSLELFDWLKKERCDVLMLDYILQSDEPDGLTLIKKLLSRHPKLKILLISSMESLAVIRTAFMLGVYGYIAKREDTTHYIQAIRSVASHQRYIPDYILVELAQVPTRKRDKTLQNGQQPFNKSMMSRLLTARETEVIRCFLDGMTIVEISAKLKRSRKTISGHKQAGLRKLGLTSDLELFKYRDDLFK